MQLCLNTTVVDYTGLEDYVALAQRHGYAAIEFSLFEVAELVEQKGLDRVKALFNESGVAPVSCGVPADWRNDEATFQRYLKEMPAMAALSRAIGCTSIWTYLNPAIDEFPAAYSVRVARRMKEMAAVLDDYGISFGLEWVSAATARADKPWPWIHRLQQVLDFEAEIDAPNMGIVLDSFHWFCEGGSIADIEALDVASIVHVHINDAPDKPLDEQEDLQRLLPGDGIIDLTGFLRGLEQIGYSGAVAVEAPGDGVQKVPEAERLRRTKKAFESLHRPAPVALSQS